MRIGASSAPYGARCGHGLALFFTAIIPISPEPCDLSGSRPKLGWYHTEPLLGLIGLRWLSAGLPMPTNLTEQIRHCHQRAIECAGKALNAGTAEARNKLLALERDWLALARGYAVDDRDAKRRLKRWRGLDAGSWKARGPRQTIVPFLTSRAFTPEMVEELSQAFNRLCTAFMVSTSDPRAEQIAGKIIELTQRGLRDSTHLFCTAIVELDLRD